MMANSLDSEKDYYSRSVEGMLEDFNIDENIGLKSSELEERYSIYGYNELPKIKKSLWKIYLAPIFNILIIIPL